MNEVLCEVGGGKGVGGNENERNEQNAVKNENDKTMKEMQLKTKRRKQ